MHQAAHVERHFTASELVRDIVIGMADGLTVPFALAAGLSGVRDVQTTLIVTARRALRSAMTIAGASIAGGLIPLAPYMAVAPNRTGTALLLSIVVTLMALLVFGYIKGHFTGTRPVRSALQTTLIGGIAAAAAFL